VAQREAAGCTANRHSSRTPSSHPVVEPAAKVMPVAVPRGKTGE
jgi:hypothetical protein